MLKIYTVCPQGLGSSMIAKIHVQNILDTLGVDYDVETAGVASIVGENFDFIITVDELRESLSHVDPSKIIIIKNFFKKDEIEEKLKKKLFEMKIIGSDQL
ncbi:MULTISPECIES: PTS sugar transporter subunit IIB [unclassified Sporolactobacillus]|uniref:PTS sugar transporter subunit IIB n=1 Tax=unclassified Sporolactobacillus TaxID=2628533 RepID=UPI0023686400|nr:PTS sugar transporter subunit IIB [Sporolactobacillus sp. CQH2019]MDD9149709.1 PTS sugar transporter subunit IIB [Sporolactobacillus sp. CQH2019]